MSFTPNPLPPNPSHTIYIPSYLYKLLLTIVDVEIGERGDKDKNNNSANDADISRPNLQCSIEYTYLQVYIIVTDRLDFIIGINSFVII